MKPSKRHAIAMTVGLIVGLLLAGQVVRMRLAESAVRSRDGELAAAVRPQNGWGRALHAAALFSRGDVKASRSESIEAIRDTPLPAMALRTLARAEDKLRGPGAGERAWQAASLLGWRDRPTQLWAMLRAASNGENEIFAMRADALLRGGDQTDTTSSFIRMLMLAPELRGAFADRVALDPPWRSTFFLPAAALTGRELQGAYLLLLELKGKQNPPRRIDLRNTVAGLIQAGRFAEAVALDRTFIARRPDPGSLIDDGGFDGTDSDYQANATPFDWMLSGGSVSLDEAGGRRIAISVDEQHRDGSIRRYVHLDPGEYHLSFSMKGDRNAPSVIALTAECASTHALLGSSSQQPLSTDGWERRRVDFIVPVACPLALLQIRPFGQAVRADALIDDVKLEESDRR